MLFLWKVVGKLKTLQHASNEVRQIRKFLSHPNVKDRLEDSEDINFLVIFCYFVLGMICYQAICNSIISTGCLFPCFRDAGWRAFPSPLLDGNNNLHIWCSHTFFPSILGGKQPIICSLNWKQGNFHPVEEHLVICWAQLGCCPGRAEGTMAISIPPVAKGLDLQPPPFPTSNQKNQHELLPSCQSLPSPAENHLLPLEKCLSRLLCSCQPTGDRTWLLTLPGAARPHSVSVLLQEFGICLSNLSAPPFPPSPSVECSWQQGGVWVPPQGRLCLSERARREEGKCW